MTLPHKLLIIVSMTVIPGSIWTCEPLSPSDFAKKSINFIANSDVDLSVSVDSSLRFGLFVDLAKDCKLLDKCDSFCQKKIRQWANVIVCSEYGFDSRRFGERATGAETCFKRMLEKSNFDDLGAVKLIRYKQRLLAQARDDTRRRIQELGKKPKMFVSYHTFC